MSGAAISVENLSKRYLVGHRATRHVRQGYPALRDAIERQARTVARKALDVVRGRQVVQGDEVEEFWALRDVSPAAASMALRKPEYSGQVTCGRYFDRAEYTAVSWGLRNNSA